MQVCKINQRKLRDALDLVWEVFEEFEKDDYGEIGTKTFSHFIEYGNMKKMVDDGQMIFWGCYLNQYLVGVLALREGQHISLLFVRSKFHRLGVAKRLIKMAIDYVKNSNPSIKAITVNSSPYAVEFYKKMGFVQEEAEKSKDGIRYTFMKYKW